MCIFVHNRMCQQLCRFESILLCVWTSCLFMHENLEWVFMCINLLGSVNSCFLYVRTCVCVSQMKAGRGVLLLAPLIGSIQTETWPSQQMSVWLPKTCTHTKSTQFSPYIALAQSFFQCLLYQPVFNCVCVSVWQWQALLISNVISEDYLTFPNWSSSIQLSTHNSQITSDQLEVCWRNLRALWKSLHPLSNETNCNGPKHKAFMERVFQLPKLLAVGECSLSCIKASGAQFVTFLLYFTALRQL